LAPLDELFQTFEEHGIVSPLESFKSVGILIGLGEKMVYRLRIESSGSNPVSKVFEITCVELLLELMLDGYGQHRNVETHCLTHERETASRDDGASPTKVFEKHRLRERANLDVSFTFQARCSVDSERKR
jgi:hypothetical protein